MSMFELAQPDPDRRARMLLLMGVLAADLSGVRARDMWVERVPDPQVEGGQRLQIALYTRVGGGNRRDYGDAIAELQGLPGYLGDRDDGFDATYATFRFAWPRERADELSSELPGGESLTEIATRVAHEGEVDTDERWREAIERVQRGGFTPGQRAQADQLIAGVRAALEGTGPPIVEV